MSGALDTLLELARRRCDEATRALGERIGEQQQMLERGRTLERYHADYLARCAQGDRGGLHAATLQRTHAFLVGIEAALARQAQEQAGADRRVAEARAALIDAQRRLEGYGALEQRALAREGARQRRRERRDEDETAVRAHARQARSEAR